MGGMRHGRRDSTTVASPYRAEIVSRVGRRAAIRLASARCASLALIVVALLAAGCGHPVVQPTAPSATDPLPTGTRQPADLAIPVGFMLHELEADERVDTFDIDASCFGEPSARSAVARNLIDGENLNRVVQELYLYADEATARQVFVRLATSELQRCVGYPHAERIGVDAPPLGDESVAVTVALPSDGAGEHAGEPLTSMAVRVGRAIAVFSSSYGATLSRTEASDAVRRL